MVFLLISLAILSLAMIPLESRWPGVPSQRRFRRGWLLDLVYWFFTTLITKPISKTAVEPALIRYPDASWEFGPLRKIFARPKLNRWHARPRMAGGVSISRATITVGHSFRYFRPASETVTRCGVPDAVPKDSIGQMAWPFRR